MTEGFPEPLVSETLAVEEAGADDVEIGYVLSAEDIRRAARAFWVSVLLTTGEYTKEEAAEEAVRQFPAVPQA